MANFTIPPPVPQRGDSATFSSRVDAFLRWLVSFVAQLNAFISSFDARAAGDAYTFGYSVNTNTASSDPGPGFIRFNNSNQNVATEIRISTSSADGGAAQSALDSILSGTSAIKGQLRISKTSDLATYLLFDVTGASVTTGSWRNLTVTPLGGTSAMPFNANDDVVLQFQRTGDRGQVGPAYQPVSAKFSERQASGVSGGSTASGTTYTRNLNTTEYNDIPGMTLSGNQISATASGTYTFTARAPGYNTGGQRAYFRNLTDSTVILGSNATGASASGNQVDAIVTGRFNITSPKQFSLQHYVTGAQGTNGLGAAIGKSGEAEIYSEVIITKIA